MKDLTIGVDIGGTNTVFGFVDKEGTIIYQDQFPTKDSNTYEGFVELLYQRINDSLLKYSDTYTFKGIGIGAPNGNYYEGTIEYAPNLNWQGVLPLAKDLGDRLDLPTILTNDANAAAIGEMVYGGAKGIRNFIMITLGTGLGSGIVIDGKVVYGHDGFAGELGHVIVKRKGRKCGCGRRGCLETYCSASGIKRTLLELLADSTEKSMLDGHTIESLSSKMIDEAARKGDKIAQKAFEITGEILGEALSNAVAFSSPEVIFLFGGLANAGELIFVPTKKYLEKNLLNIYKKKVKVLPSSLNEADAAILGASALIWEAY